MARKLDSFRGRRPNRIVGPNADTLRFLQTDPLPTVELTVNGRGPFLFLIDTGGGELTLDPTFGDSVHAARFGAESGQFAGGKRRDVLHATADSVQIGRFVVHEVPLLLLDTSRLSGVVGGARVAGILGTTLLGRFRFTLDYRDGALVLERRSPRAPCPRPPDRTARCCRSGWPAITSCWRAARSARARRSPGSSTPDSRARPLPVRRRR